MRAVEEIGCLVGGGEGGQGVPALHCTRTEGSVCGEWRVVAPSHEEDECKGTFTCGNLLIVAQLVRMLCQLVYTVVCRPTILQW